MENDLHRRILEDFAQPSRGSDGDRVDHGAPFARCDLEEVNSVDEPMEARSFGVERYLTNAGNVVEKKLDLFRSIEIKE